MRTAVVRSLSLHRRIAQRHRQKNAALDAAEKRVDALLRGKAGGAEASGLAKGGAAGGGEGKAGETGWTQAVFANRGLRWAGLSWLVSCSVVAFLMYNRPDESELDVLSRDFRSVAKEVEEERERNGGQAPSDPQLRRWENHYRRIHNEDLFVLPPWKVMRLEGMRGWTWEPDADAEAVGRNPVRKADPVTKGAAAVAQQRGGGA